jgi:PAS domain S-box-containing protein
MTAPLRVLLLEDSPSDAELIQELLEAEHFVGETRCVQTRDEFLLALQSGEVDLVLADYHLPGFDGFSALRLALGICPDVPFIFVSGTLGEEVAIEALKIGATDYVLKTRLSRLIPAVQRALREADERAERKKAEEAARRSERELVEVIETIPAVAFTTSADGSAGWVNRRWSEYTGLPSGEGWQATLHPEDLDEHLAKWHRSIASGEPFENEARHRSAEGEYRFFLVRAVPLRDERGKVVRWYGTLTDIEDRKRAEQERARLRQLESDLAYMGRILTMGELAASLAHEIKQPITAAVMNAEACRHWLRHDAPEVVQAADAASSMLANAMRAAEIIDKVRSLYLKGRSSREPFDLHEVVREITILLSDTAKRDSVSIRTELDDGLPKATGDRVQLQQVLMNLMLNAVEAMKDAGGELTVSGKPTEDGHLLISVSDTGMGLPSDDPGRLFEAFFTTKPQGTGLGLCISRRIVESHGGRLWASANSGRGATFNFTLPTEVGT